MQWLQVEGILPAAPDTVYQFLQLSTQPGGKLDYIFRNEAMLQQFEGSNYIYITNSNTSDITCVHIITVHYV